MSRKQPLPDSIPSPTEYLSPEQCLAAIADVLADIMLDAMKKKKNAHEDKSRRP